MIYTVILTIETIDEDTSLQAPYVSIAAAEDWFRRHPGYLIGSEIVEGEQEHGPFYSGPKPWKEIT